MLNFRQITNVSVFSLAVGFMLPANAIANFDSIEVSTLDGSNDTTNAQTFTSTGPSSNEEDFIDDVFLEGVTFDNGSSSATISGAANFAAVNRITVVSGRANGSDANVNGESGFDDDNSDGDPDNFAKVGLDINTDRESTDPLTQDLGLFSALNNRSLSEIADGEGGNNPYELKFTFTQGIVDSDNGNDQAPELIIFERGINDGDIKIELITGGTFDSPTIFGTSFAEESNNYTDTGINIRTSEIDKFQDLGILGLDFSEDFGLTSGAPVYGIILTSTDGGADINGALLSAADTSQFRELPDGLDSRQPGQPVPFEVEGTMGFLALGGYLWYRKHKKHQRIQDQ